MRPDGSILLAGVPLASLLALVCLVLPARPCLADDPAPGPAKRVAAPLQGPRRETVPDEQLKQIIVGLGDDDAEVRRVARVRLKNLPAGAYETLRDRYNPDAFDPETTTTLQAAMKTLAARWRQFQRTSADLAWHQHQVLDAYGRAGKHDPRWDAAARAALASLGEPSTLGKYSEATGDLALFKKAADAGCDDPLVWTFYAICQLDQWPSDPWPLSELTGPEAGGPHTPGEAPPSALAGLPRRWGSGKSVPDLEPGTPEHLRSAAEAMKAGDYPARLKCLAFQTFARALVAIGGDRAEARRFMDASFDELPEAIKTPGFPADRQAEMVLDQWRGTAALDPAQSALPLDRIQTLYDAAAGKSPDKSPIRLGALLFKAEASRRFALSVRGNRPMEELPPPQQKEFAERMTVAKEALESACKLDPGDGSAAAGMVAIEWALATTPKGRESAETWFQRAMEADPDNYLACWQKMWALASLSPAVMESIANGNGDLFEFGRQCLDTENFRGRVAFILADAHLLMARQGGEPREYLRQPAVWNDILQTYENCLRVFPDSTHDRSMYAKLAYAAGEYEESDRQFVALAGRGETYLWGGQSGLDFFRLDAARRARRARGAAAVGPGMGAAPAPPADPAFAKALQDAADAMDAGADFEKPLRSVAASFTEAKVCAEPGKADWNRLTLNAAGKGIDCIRFRTPKGKPTDLRWAFVIGSDRYTSWYILRADKAAMPGFTEYTGFDPKTVERLQGPGDGGVHAANVQALPAASLRPDTEYLIWFRFRDREPVRTSVAVTFVPPAGKPADWQAILNDLGLKRVGE